jgi:thymidylate synthase ThyX
MTQITAKCVAASVNSYGRAIHTLELQYPRFIHSEFMTHRVFSRNAASSRAIPVSKMIQQVRNDPTMPIHWGKNQPGMQAHEQLADTVEVQQQWRNAARDAANRAEQMSALGLHKQVVNRVLEPFQLMRTIVTSTTWENFLHLRDHPDAQPEIQALAQAMRVALETEPEKLIPGQWHLPYVKAGERDLYKREVLLKLSTARCARVSYLTHDGAEPDISKDVELYERLVGSHPIHASPAEHQATPSEFADHQSGNFVGWIQHRKLIERRLA